MVEERQREVILFALERNMKTTITQKKTETKSRCKSSYLLDFERLHCNLTLQHLFGHVTKTQNIAACCERFRSALRC